MLAFFLRRISMAFSMSPPASMSAALQSIIGALVLSRSAFTSAAEMFMRTYRITSGLEDSPQGLDDNRFKPKPAGESSSLRGGRNIRIRVRERALGSGSVRLREEEHQDGH